jgi:hypothetical protein
MGLRDLLHRWTKGEDERALEREEEAEEGRLSAAQRAASAEDFEAKKDDAAAARSLGGATDAVDDLE